MIHTIGYAVTDPKAPFTPFRFERRTLTAHDVHLEILYCGVCHSDLHIARNDWGRTQYPCVPGHEIVGKVLAVGSLVSKFKVGDIAAVGCMVDSCRTCQCCIAGEEQYCEHGATMTYGGYDRHSKGITYGGYSNHIVVDEAFTLHVPAGLDLAAVAPLLCAGITTYSPLKHWGVKAGQTVGIVGIGGLGHIAIKLARALGAHVVAITRSASKKDDALALGAHEVIVSANREELKAYRNRLDFILDTVSAAHDINALLGLLRLNGTLCQVGLPAQPLAVNAFSLTGQRRQLAGSFIGGIAQTQEMLNFCAKHGIVCDIELITLQDLDAAYERLEKSEVKYRFVIDMASLTATHPT